MPLTEEVEQPGQTEERDDGDEPTPQVNLEAAHLISVVA